MGRIIGISGRKQAGKNTVANYIHGDILKSRGMIQDFFINKDGQLAIQTTDHNGKLDYGILDIYRKDKSFIDYAEVEMWPYVKIYSFADYLKELCISLFGMSHQQVYGTDKQKNSETKILWENMPLEHGSLIEREGPMTAREFMQHFGTNIVRKIYHDAWTRSTMRKIMVEDSEIAIISDVRFPNEVDAVKNYVGVVVRLNRNVYNSEHESECALDEQNFDWSNFDYVIDNDSISIDDLCKQLSELKKTWS